MCLAVPMTITQIDGEFGVASARGVETRVNLALVPDIKINDKVIIHAGFVIEKLDEDEAAKTDQIWDEYERCMGIGDGNGNRA